MIAKRIIIFAVIVLCVAGTVLFYVRNIRKNDFRTSIENLHTEEIVSVVIEKEGKAAIVIDHNQIDMLGKFLTILKGMQKWRPEHPTVTEYIYITIHTLKSKYSLECMLVKEKPGVVFFDYVEGQIIVGNFQNRGLYRFLKDLFVI